MRARSAARPSWWTGTGPRRADDAHLTCAKRRWVGVERAQLFSATCPQCGQGTRFVELKVEACLQPDEGTSKAWYGFKCLACNKRMKQVPVAAGVHQWVDGRHVVA